ncbi:putative zinc metallopeptidase [gamma proteobacterium BDW918]|nr:SprT-like domain-containing protein [Zhongshania aliphaticivorans]EIF44140.1 putative zinc metallopeptidase [gamma proteobacterium BDW918]
MLFLLNAQSMNPTTDLYQALEKAYGHFNSELFDKALPEVIFTFQRKSGIMGYFSPERWGNAAGDTRNEIAINPSFLASSRLIEICQTLVHEMVHCWQHQYGKPSRKGYHNLEWAKKMMSVGLMPSSTGEPGGEILGQAMGDYIIEEGQFIKAFEALTESIKFDFPWFDRKALPRLYNPVIAAFPRKDEHQAVAGGLKLKSESTLPSELTQGLIENGAVRTLVNYEGYQDRETLAGMAPDAFVIHEAPKKPTRIKYICEGCGTKIYGKTKLNISCDDCSRSFYAVDQ